MAVTRSNARMPPMVWLALVAACASARDVPRGESAARAAAESGGGTSAFGRAATEAAHPPTLEGAAPDRAATEAAHPPTLEGAALAEAIGAALAQACPVEALEDPAARASCADALTRDPTLRVSLPRSALRWGAQAPGAGLDLARSNTTWLDSLVWKRMYLSTFAFPGGHRVDQDGGRFIARVPVVFRNALDPGEYPYPFWHSQAKWQSYEQSDALLFFVERGSILAVLRSASLDASRPHVERAWDEHWVWRSDRGEEPHVVLFTYLFSDENPHVALLERAFRAFSEQQRAAACTTCHNPSNPSKINPLEFFNYPNQALTARHDIVREIANNRMPPARDGVPAGIADEGYRRALLESAERFAAAGDAALAYESAAH